MPSRAQPWRRRSGFALLITITLLAFLVLLLVSLASLTRVETQVASNNQSLIQARQNAVMGLNIALGRLQSLAGPDQRVTATAEIIPGAQADQRKWTGVWNTTSAAPSPDWLVSTATPAAASGPAAVTSALPSTGIVQLVGSNSADTSTAGNAVKVQSQPITSDVVPGFAGSQTVGNFAYWVGDEGVKARVGIADDWADPATAAATVPPSTTQQADAYRFINAQRVGIETVSAAAGATYSPIAGSYPTNAAVLARIIDLKQLSLSGSSAPAQTTLGAAVKNRFHDLTASSRSVLADVAKGGLRKDLTAWIADTTSTTPVPSSPATAADDYITPGDAADSAKYGLPKWELIRSYAALKDSGAALAPQVPTAARHGLSPVITYARVGYNVTLPPGGSGNYRINVMPVVTLWNPWNVPIQQSTGPANTYEFCIKYKPSVFNGFGNVPVPDGVRLKLVPFYPTGTVLGPNDTKTDTFYVGSLQMFGPVAGPLGPANTYASYAIGTSPALSTSSSTEPVYWRFKVVLSKDLAPGESRIFTISDGSDDTQYVAGQSELGDAVLGSNNGVFIPSTTPLTAKQMSSDARMFWNTEPVPADTGARADWALVEFRLTKPVPSGVSTLAAVDAFLGDPENTYQAVLGNAFDWRPDTNPYFALGNTIPPSNSGIAYVYQRIELLMSSNYDRFVSGFVGNDGKTNLGAGTPRWLAQLNPQAAVMLRRPHSPTSADTPSRAAVLTPSYEAQRYVAYTPAPLDFPYIDIPESDGTNVSAGTEVSTTGSARNVVLRGFQPATVPLFSIGQLQQVNASLLSINPAYPIGNSLPNLYVPLTATQSATLPQDAFNTYDPRNTHPGFPSSATFKHVYDLSYLLNKALWDSCFFSTVPSGLASASQITSGYRLPNARHTFYWRADAAAEFAELKTTDSAAAHLLVNGGFNVNSASEQAWLALLSSHVGVATDPSDPSARRHPFSRLSAPTDPSQPNTPWNGYRILSDEQLRELSKAIVAEVRKRGPFLSLADFVNRRLVDGETGFKGALQAAIDATATGSASINGDPAFNFPGAPVRVYSADITSAATPDVALRKIYKGDAAGDTLPGSTPATSRSAFAPGYVTQADLLSALGPSLAARSDTFRIRAYGDVVKPVDPSAPVARAWCEAIVQRLPDYIESSASPSAKPAAGSLSETFGRRFQIVSFRWLTLDEI